MARDESRVASIAEIADRFGMKKANTYQYVLELASRGLVESRGKLGYVLDWLTSNRQKFEGSAYVDCYGAMEDDVFCVLPSVLDKVLVDNGFDARDL